MPTDSIAGIWFSACGAGSKRELVRLAAPCAGDLRRERRSLAGRQLPNQQPHHTLQKRAVRAFRRLRCALHHDGDFTALEIGLDACALGELIERSAVDSLMHLCQLARDDCAPRSAERRFEIRETL